MSRKKIIILCLGILGAAILITTLVFMTEPTAQSEGATKESAMLVNLVNAEGGTFIPKIVATGTVRPVEDVMISPLVNGQVVNRGADFVPGGFLQKGDLLLQIDPSDYRNSLELRKSELLQAITNLELEMGRQFIAEQDLQLIAGDTLSQNQKDLVLRKPQLNAVKATIQSAQAAVDQAQANLGRTSLRAPFDAHILTQNVTVGSQVSPGDNLGRLVGTDYYWVEVTVPISKLKWLSFPNTNSDTGSEVQIRNTTAWPSGEYRTGSLDRQIGALDNQTRLARVLVKVKDPLAYNDTLQEQQKLIIGSFVEVEIKGEPIKNVVRIDRELVRTDNTVWVMENGKLKIKNVSIELTDNRYAYVKDGLEEGSQVVTTNLSTIADGIPLRSEADSTGTTSNKSSEE